MQAYALQTCTIKSLKILKCIHSRAHQTEEKRVMISKQDIKSCVVGGEKWMKKTYGKLGTAVKEQSSSYSGSR